MDYKRANDLMLASAARNNALAFMYLGQVAKDGSKGNQKDLKQAYAWFSLAAAVDPNDIAASNARDSLKLSPSDAISAQEIANVWKAKTPQLVDYYNLSKS